MTLQNLPAKRMQLLRRTLKDAHLDGYLTVSTVEQLFVGH